MLYLAIKPCYSWLEFSFYAPGVLSLCKAYLCCIIFENCLCGHMLMEIQSYSADSWASKEPGAGTRRRNPTQFDVANLLLSWSEWSALYGYVMPKITLVTFQFQEKRLYKCGRGWIQHVHSPHLEECSVDRTGTEQPCNISTETELQCLFKKWTCDHVNSMQNLRLSTVVNKTVGRISENMAAWHFS